MTVAPPARLLRERAWLLRQPRLPRSSATHHFRRLFFALFQVPPERRAFARNQLPPMPVALSLTLPAPRGFARKRTPTARPRPAAPSTPCALAPLHPDQKRN